MRPAALPLLLLIAGAAAPAQTVYKIVNPDGSAHYTDRRPDNLAGVELIKTRAEQQQISHVRVESRGERRVVVGSNLIHGPLEVELRFEGADNVLADPPLPLRTLIQAASERVLAEVQPADRYQSARFGVAMAATPGDPAGIAEPVDYLLPVDTGEWRLDQGWNGGFSHHDPQSRYAIDLNVAEGTPVLAARDGVVMQVEDDFEGAGLNFDKYASRANHIRILHADGSMAVYAHLQPESVVVRPGARVHAGQRLAKSGNTGYSSGPHLHFAVQLNRGMRLESVPFRMTGPGGPVAIPEQ